MKKSIRCFFAVAAVLLSTGVYGVKNIPVVDISQETNRHTVVEKGTPKVYWGHPSTVLSRDGKKVFCVWTTDHGGACGPAAESLDGGKTWKRVDERFPEIYLKDHYCCPTLQELVKPDGSVRWLNFARRGPWSRTTRRLFGKLGVTVSDDEGATWRELGPFDFPTSMPPTGWLRLKDGSYALFGQYYIIPKNPAEFPSEEFVWMSVTRDGGESWSPMRQIARTPGKWLCEPFAIRSPDGSEIAVLLRENHRRGDSMVVFSRDEGKTWTSPVDTCWGLTGDRHQAICLPDGRLLVAFRDMAPKSPTFGHYMAWVGPFSQITSKGTGKGTYRIKLLHSYHGNDCGYSGVELMPDGEILCTTYIKYRKDKCKHSVVSTRFRIEETDRRVKLPDIAPIGH